MHNENCRRRFEMILLETGDARIARLTEMLAEEMQEQIERTEMRDTDERPEGPGEEYDPGGDPDDVVMVAAGMRKSKRWGDHAREMEDELRMYGQEATWQRYAPHRESPRGRPI